MSADDGFLRETRDELTSSALDVEQCLSTLSPGIQSSARTAAILLMPTDLGDQHSRGCFPERTRDVLEFVGERLPEGVTVEAAVDDEDYTEYAFKSIDIILPVIFVAEPLMTSVVASLLVDYVRSVVARNRGEEAYVRSDLHFTVAPDGSKTLRHVYDGPAETYERSLARLERIAEGTSGTDKADRDCPT